MKKLNGEIDTCTAYAYAVIAEEVPRGASGATAVALHRNGISAASSFNLGLATKLSGENGPRHKSCAC